MIFYPSHQLSFELEINSFFGSILLYNFSSWDEPTIVVGTGSPLHKNSTLVWCEKKWYSTNSIVASYFLIPNFIYIRVIHWLQVSTRCSGLICGKGRVSFDGRLQIGPIGPLFSKCAGFMLETSPFWFAWGYSDKFAQIVLHLHGHFTHWGQRYPTSFHTQWKVSG